MLYDLSIAWSPSTSASDLKKTLKFSSSLGYNVVALNHSITIPLPPKITNSLPRFPETTSSTSSSIPGSKDNDGIPTILHRATVPISDPAVHLRLSELARAYDMLAVRPTTERAFHAACISIEHVSLISLDLTSSLGFHFKPASCMAAVRRGVLFEICYAQILGADSRGRANFISNSMNLMRATRGRGFVVSSEARGVMGLRAPADVCNLLAVWGLASDKGMEGLGANPRSLAVTEGLKRRGFRGVVDIVQVAEREEGDKMEWVEEQGQERDGPKNQQKASNAGGKTNNAGAQKRKEGADGEQGEAPISKRKAKKLKHLAMQEAKAAKEKAEEQRA
ncbi:RNase P subunit p30-domain-containing protein [Xylariales sp. AK1849]|nr:RNase P subunit p30-domain-containing protein [Xylariales sp. AK1849]